MIPEKPEPVTTPILEGIAKTPTAKSLLDFDIGVHVRVRMGNDLEACRNAVRPELALYVCGMDARDKNFSKESMKQIALEEAAEAIQDRFLRRERTGGATPCLDDCLDARCIVDWAD